jgi:hypothetical protein
MHCFSLAQSGQLGLASSHVSGQALQVLGQCCAIQSGKATQSSASPQAAQRLSASAQCGSPQTPHDFLGPGRTVGRNLLILGLDQIDYTYFVVILKLVMTHCG